MDRQTDFR